MKMTDVFDFEAFLNSEDFRGAQYRGVACGGHRDLRRLRVAIVATGRFDGSVHPAHASHPACTVVASGLTGWGRYLGGE